MPPPDRLLLLRELVALELVYRHRRGEVLTATTYRERFPDLDPAWLEREIRQIGGDSPGTGQAAPDTEPRQADDSYPTNPPLESFVPQRTAFPGGPALPGYEVLGELGRGGMGVVYLAKNKLMNRLEVLKVMNKEMLDRAGGKERFLREIQSAARLSHPNVVTAYSALELGDLLVFAMEYIDGEDLARFVSVRGPLPVANACYYTQQAALGLQHAFEKKLVHRDIKPQNLILSREGKKHLVKVLDFGLAKVLREKGEDAGLTGTGQVLGTPDYIAPEQIQDAARADIRADIYSLGCTLYHLLAGTPPFKCKSLYEKFQAHHSLEAKPLNQERPEVPEELAAVVRKMMAKDPARRYQTPIEVAQALAPFIKQEMKGTPVERSRELSQRIEAHDRMAEKEADVRSIPTPKGKAAEERARVKSSATMKPSSVQRDTKAGDRSTSIESREGKAVCKAPSPVGKPAAKKWWLITVGAMVALLLLGLLALWAGGVFKAKTPNGTIVVENVSADAEVQVEERTVLVTREGAVVTVTAVAEGPHRLKVVQGGQAILSTIVTVKLGGEPVRLKMEPLSKTATEELGKDNPPVEVGNAERRELLETVLADLSGNVRMEFVRIPRGTYLMGSPQDEQDRHDDEGQHEVEISRDFFLSKYAVTQQQYEALMGSNPSYFSVKGDGKEIVRGLDTSRFPVEQVSWYDAVRYCEKLTEKYGKGGRTYRLPTEAEWEYACRAGRETPFAFGSSCNGREANCDGNLPYGTSTKGPNLERTCAVGSYAAKAPHPWGLCDMHGNVYQWCQDWYNKDYYAKRNKRDPQGPNDGTSRVVRGGSWGKYPRLCRAACRGWRAPSDRGINVGFRIAFSLD
jgi:formylglycine-generating enzyme required for sulfatase activity/serine/threonine protein kinase